MKNFYLIDFENVKSAGLSTIKPLLKKNDVIYVFYSDKANTANIEVLLEIEKLDVHLHFMKVQNGQKDALDWQLSTYLGYLIHKYKKDKYKYHIVSKDHGFQILLSFWKDVDLNIITVEEKKGEPKKATSRKSKKVMIAPKVKEETVENKNYNLLAIKYGEFKGVYKYNSYKERQDIEKIVGGNKRNRKSFNCKQEQEALVFAGVDKVATLDSLTMKLN